ncbi:unnamed protein product [Colias eurytheme]|nr:unnamed protein product [Colias eurytheme]
MMVLFPSIKLLVRQFRPASRVPSDRRVVAIWVNKFGMQCFNISVVEITSLQKQYSRNGEPSPCTCQRAAAGGRLTGGAYNNGCNLLPNCGPVECSIAPPASRRERPSALPAASVSDNHQLRVWLVPWMYTEVPRFGRAVLLQLVVNLAIVVYHALDYTHGEDEERLVSPDLEALITDMTNGNIAEEDEECGMSEGSETSEGGRADTDDEGIERDAEPAPRRRRRLRTFLLKDVVERCVWHCGGRGARARDSAAAHYRAVCRALVAEALELASFLARVRVTAARDLGAHEDSAMHLDTLHFSDWARFWMQVIGELRMGVKLKKVNYSRTPIEYELTPYEILMDDIRSRRYTLRKVDGAIPHNVKKDAHAMILEFIRSRPPLKKASERKLAPARREVTPREQLLRSIQLGRPLRPTPYSHHSHHSPHSPHSPHSHHPHHSHHSPRAAYSRTHHVSGKSRSARKTCILIRDPNLRIQGRRYNRQFSSSAPAPSGLSCVSSS